MRYSELGHRAQVAIPPPAGRVAELGSLDVVARRSKRIPPGHWNRLRAVLIWSSVFLPLLIH